jgi:hypothetical protein
MSLNPVSVSVLVLLVGCCGVCMVWFSMTGL